MHNNSSYEYINEKIDHVTNNQSDIYQKTLSKESEKVDRRIAAMVWSNVIMGGLLVIMGANCLGYCQTVWIHSRMVTLAIKKKTVW